MIYATCFSLLLAAAALAADIKIEGETKVEGDKLVRLNVAAPAKSGVIWDVWPEGKADVEEIPGGKLIFTGPSGEYTVKARVITSVDGAIKIDTGRATVTIGTPAPPIPPLPPGPTPPGPPGPTPPGPDPSPAPIPIDGFRVMILYENSDTTLPAGQRNIIRGQEFRRYLDLAVATGTDGTTPEYRIYDDDLDLSGEAAHWRKAYEDAKAKRQQAHANKEIPYADNFPWLIVSNGTTGFSGPLPADVDAAILELSKHRKK